MYIIEVMLFKLEDNGEIPAQKLFTILPDTHVIKTNAKNPWVKVMNWIFRITKLKISPTLSVQVQITLGKFWKHRTM